MELVRFPVLKEEFYAMYRDIMQRGYPALVFGIYATVTQDKVAKKEVEDLLDDIQAVMKSFSFFNGFSDDAFMDLSNAIEKAAVDTDVFDSRLYLNEAVHLLEEIYEMLNSMYTGETFMMNDKVDSVMFAPVANYLLAAGINEFVGEPSYNDAVFGTIN